MQAIRAFGATLLLFFSRARSQLGNKLQYYWPIIVFKARSTFTSLKNWWIHAGWPFMQSNWKQIWMIISVLFFINSLLARPFRWEYTLGFGLSIVASIITIYGKWGDVIPFISKKVEQVFDWLVNVAIPYVWNEWVMPLAKLIIRGIEYILKNHWDWLLLVIALVGLYLSVKKEDVDGEEILFWILLVIAAGITIAKKWKEVLEGIVTIFERVVSWYLKKMFGSGLASSLLWIGGTLIVWGMILSTQGGTVLLPYLGAVDGSFIAFWGIVLMASSFLVKGNSGGP